MSKPSFDDIYMELAENLAKRSHCVKAQVGAVLTKDTRIVPLATTVRRQEPTTAMKSGRRTAARATVKEAARWPCMRNRMLFCMPPKTIFRSKALRCM